MIAFLVKQDENSYDLICQLENSFSFRILSTLFRKDFDLMIEYMEQMRVSNHLPFFYFFPKYKIAPEIDVRLVKRKGNDYQLILNLGSHILSEMDSNEFDYLLSECKDLIVSEVGSKVYFSPVKEISNDK